EDEWGGRGGRVDPGRRLAVHQVRAQPDPAEEAAQHALRQRDRAGRAVRQVDAKVTAVVAEHASSPFPVARTGPCHYHRFWRDSSRRRWRRRRFSSLSRNGLNTAVSRMTPTTTPRQKP